MSKKNIFSRLFQGQSKPENISTPEQRGVFSYFGGVPTGSVMSIQDLNTTVIDENGALKIVAFYECAKEVSEAIAMLPKHFYKATPEGQEKFPLYKHAFKLKIRPNDHVSSFNFFRTWVLHMLTYGNGYVLIERQGSKIVAFHNRRRMYPVLDKEKRLWYYDWETSKVYDHLDVLHLADLSEDEYLGKSKAKLHALTLGKSKSADSLANKLYTNGSFLGAIIEYPENIDSDDINTAELRATIKAQYSGIEKSGAIMTVTRGGKFKQLQTDVPLADAEYIANSKLTTDEIRAMFNMPPKDGGSYNSLEHKNLEILQKALQPIITQIEQEINFKVVDPDERGSIWMNHSFEGFLRSDSKTRAEFYRMMVPIGGLLINEMRALEGLPPVEGGDVPMFQANNMLPLSMADEYGQAMLKKLLTGTEPKKEEE